MMKMQLYGALILLVSLSAASGLRCYSCYGSASNCTNILTCPTGLDRCSSVQTQGVLVKSCMSSVLCISPVSCCQVDLCNSAGPTGPRVLLLLLSSALLLFFI